MIRVTTFFMWKIELLLKQIMKIHHLQAQPRNITPDPPPTQATSHYSLSDFNPILFLTFQHPINVLKEAFFKRISQTLNLLPLEDIDIVLINME